MFAWVGTQFDAVLNTYVLGVVTALMAGIAPIALTAMTIWVTLYGWAVLRNEVSETVPTFLWKVFKIGLVLAFALQSGFYVSNVSDSANALATGVATTFLPGSERSDGPDPQCRSRFAQRRNESATNRPHPRIPASFTPASCVRADVTADFSPQASSAGTLLGVRINRSDPSRDATAGRPALATRNRGSTIALALPPFPRIHGTAFLGSKKSAAASSSPG